MTSKFQRSLIYSALLHPVDTYPAPTLNSQAPWLIISKKWLYRLWQNNTMPDTY